MHVVPPWNFFQPASGGSRDQTFSLRVKLGRRLLATLLYFTTLLKLVVHVNLTYGLSELHLLLVIREWQHNADIVKKSITIDHFTHLHCCIIISFRSTDSAAFYTWHKLRVLQKETWVMWLKCTSKINVCTAKLNSCQV